MKKILPIATPPVIGYLHHAYPLSILANWTAYLPWFHSNYIQLYCPQNLQNLRGQRTMKFNFYRRPDQRASFSPYLKVQLLDRDLIFNSLKDIVPFIMACIDKGYYVQPMVNEYFLPDSVAYQQKHLVHETLIYGYDKQTFIGIGYNKQGDYATYHIAFSELEQAIVQADLTHHYDSEGLRLFKYASHKKYNFDIHLVQEQLTDLLYARNTSQRFRMLANPDGGAYGLATYECLKHFLASFLYPPFSFDIRPAHILWEHKKCMVDKLKYMENHGYLKSEYGFSTEYGELARNTGMVRMMLLKFKITRNPDLIHRVLSSLGKIAEAEKILLQNLLDKLHGSI